MAEIRYLLRHACVAGWDSLVDIALNDTITAIAPSDSPEAAALSAQDVWELAGKVVLPGLVDAHVHLDKTLSTTQNQSGTLLEAIEVWQAHKGQQDAASYHGRALRAVEMALNRGVVAMRSHVDIDPSGDMTALQAVQQLQRQFADYLTIQTVALGQPSNPADRGMEAALEQGVDLIGGCPALTPDPEACIRAVFALAERSGKAIDLHIDETEDPQMLSLELLAEATIAHGMQGRVTAGHCCSLAFVDDARAREVIAKVAAADMHVVTLPSCNLVLMGRGHQPLPRGLTRVKELLEAGVNVCAASDNVADPFNPFGSYDPLQIANLTAHCAHMSGDAEWPQCLQMVTDAAARSLALPNYGLAVGKHADLVVCDAYSQHEALCGLPARLMLFRHGRLLYHHSLQQHWMQAMPWQQT